MDRSHWIIALFLVLLVLSSCDEGLNPLSQSSPRARSVDALGTSIGHPGNIPITATLNINNLPQYNYVELIGNLAPPRSIVLTLEAKL